MKIHKRWTPNLIAGVLFLSVFFVPCAGAQTGGEVSEELKASIQQAVTAAISDSNLATKTDVTESVQTAVSNATKNLATKTALEELDRKVDSISVSPASPSNPELESFATKVANNIMNEGTGRNLARQSDVSSAKTPAWIFGVLGLLTLACLVLLILVLIPLAPMLNKEKYEAKQKTKNEADWDSYFNGIFQKIQKETDKIDAIKNAVDNIKQPPTVDAISGAVKEDVKGIVSASVTPALTDLNTKIDKLPKSDKIAEAVYDLVGADTEKTRKFVESVEEKYKKLDNMLSKCGDLVQLQDMLNKKLEDIDKQARGLDARLEDIKTREAKLNEEKSGLAEKIEEAKKNFKNQFEQEKKDLEYSFELERKDFEKAKAVFEKEKASLEQTYAQEKADLKKDLEHSFELERKDFEKEKADLVQKSEQAKADFEQEKANLEQKSEQEKAGLKKDLEHSFELEKTESDAKISGLQTRVADLDQQIDAYSKQLQAAEKDKTRLEGEKATLSQEKQTLNTEKQTLTDRINELTAEKLTLRDEIQSGYESQIQTLNAEKDQLANELASEKRQTEALEEKNQKNQQENERLGQELAAARNLNQKAESIIYPAEFLSDPRFAILKQHLDGWTDTPESAIVRASIQLFSQRASLKEDTVALALRDIAFGISQTLSSRKATPSEIIAELISWRDFIQGYSNENLRFNLSIPNLGDAYTNTTMTSARKIDRVQKVLSWSVVITRQNMNPIKKLAEVE